MPNKPFILALETSGRTGSIALATPDQLLKQITFDTQVRHSKEIFPAITSLLEEFKAAPSDIRQIYISIGPGSFTGLRVAATIAKMLVIAEPSVKIVAVDSLDCVAANFPDSDSATDCIAAILDAKRSSFFAAVYSRNLKDSPDAHFYDKWQKNLDDCLITADDFLGRFADPANPITILGEGLYYYKNKFTHPAVTIAHHPLWIPSAKGIYNLGRELAKQGSFVDPLALTPKYMQRPDIKPKNQ